MKWLLLALLLLGNVVYLGIELSRETRMRIQGVSALKVPVGAKPLRLLSELQEPPPLREGSIEQATSDADDLLADLSAVGTETSTVDGLVSDLPELEPESVPMDAIASSCFSFGPIPDELQATGLTDWFTSRGALAQIRYSDEQARQLLWIYLAPQQSRQSALAVLDELKNKGISDYRLISHGNLQNAISLGLFSSQAAVNNRLRELQRKGYKPVVVPYANVRRIYWIDVELQIEDSLLEQVFKDYPARYNSVPVKCSEIAIASTNS